MSLNYGLSECFTISEVLLMGKKLIITHEGFVKRLVDLCVRSGLSGMQRQEKDQHIDVGGEI